MCHGAHATDIMKAVTILCSVFWRVRPLLVGRPKKVYRERT